MRKTLSGTLLTLTILLLTLVLSTSSSGGKSVSSYVKTVGPSESIQEAINNANPGDTIIISQGTYKQWHIIVNKTLTIVGESLENTIIDGDGVADVIFQIVANNVVIENFTLQNTSTDPSTQGTAIRIYRSANVQVSKVVAKNNYCGIELLSVNFTKVTHCKIFNSTTYGVYIHSRSCNNTFVANTVADNSIGISIADRESRYNAFYHNNFVNNTNNVVSWSGNYFDNGYPSGGNYWSTHIRLDLKHGTYQNESGSDGIVDISYPDKQTPLDRYPLANPIIDFEIKVYGEVFEIVVSTNSSLKSCTFSPDSKSLRLTLSGTDGTFSVCRVSIPKRMLSCKEPSQWMLTSLDDGNLDYFVLEDEENTYLYFTFNQSDETIIEIKGTDAIPEFESIFMLIAWFGIINVVYILLMKPLRKWKAKY